MYVSGEDDCFIMVFGNGCGVENNIEMIIRFNIIIFVVVVMFGIEG